MSANADPNAHGNHEVRFEPTDVATRPIVTAVVALTCFFLVFTGIAYVVFQGFAARERAASPAPSPLARPSSAPTPDGVLGDYGAATQKFAHESALVVPEPRLQLEPKTDLVVLRTAEDKALRTLDWVDKQAGVVRVPIERAMEMLVARGLPARQAPVPAKMAPRGVAPSQPGEAAGAPDWQEGTFGALPAGGHAAAGHGESTHGDASHGDASKAHGGH